MQDYKEQEIDLQVTDNITSSLDEKTLLDKKLA